MVKSQSEGRDIATKPDMGYFPLLLHAVKLVVENTGTTGGWVRPVRAMEVHVMSSRSR